jgi:hypothetical protein
MSTPSTHCEFEVITEYRGEKTTTFSIPMPFGPMPRFYLPNSQVEYVKKKDRDHFTRIRIPRWLAEDRGMDFHQEQSDLAYGVRKEAIDSNT